MNIDKLREELHDRGRRTVRFQHWDPYIRGDDTELRTELKLAIEVARIERDRWSMGRFPSVQLCLADALFSKQRTYGTAVRNAVRPFASRFGSQLLGNFCEHSWRDVYSGTFGRPSTSTSHVHHHLSNEGRVVSVLAAARLLLQRGWHTPDLVRDQLRTPAGQADVRGLLESVPGVGPALSAYTLMNFGHLTVKADVHVIAVLAPLLGLHSGASPRRYEEALTLAAPELGIDPFTVDQLVWYSEAALIGTAGTRRVFEPVDRHHRQPGYERTTSTPICRTEACDAV